MYCASTPRKNALNGADDESGVVVDGAVALRFLEGPDVNEDDGDGDGGGDDGDGDSDGVARRLKIRYITRASIVFCESWTKSRKTSASTGTVTPGAHLEPASCLRVISDLCFTCLPSLAAAAASVPSGAFFSFHFRVAISVKRGHHSFCSMNFGEKGGS
jgi:hypothetical protein